MAGINRPDNGIERKFSCLNALVNRNEDALLESFGVCYIQALLLDKPITILGDLNCDGLKKTGTEYKALEKFCTDMNLKQLITKPTRITAITQSLLDVILVSSNNSVLVSGVIH